MSILDLYAKGTSTGAAPRPGSGLPKAADTIAKLRFDSQYDTTTAGNKNSDFAEGIAGEAAAAASMLAFDSKYDRNNANKVGSTYLDKIVAIQKAGSDTAADPIVANALSNHAYKPKRYMNGAFDRINTSTNSMVSRAIGQNATMLGPGNFPTDTVPYTQRVFSQQVINSGMATSDRITYSAYQATAVAVAPTPTQAASTIVPILTPGQGSNIATISGMGSTVDDGRYNITIGWGFVQYGNLTNGGYSS